MEVVVVFLNFRPIHGTLNLEEFGAEIFVAEEDIDILRVGYELFENIFCLCKLSLSRNWNPKINLVGRFDKLWIKWKRTCIVGVFDFDIIGGGLRSEPGGGNIAFLLFIFFLFLGILIEVSVA